MVPSNDASVHPERDSHVLNHLSTVFGAVAMGFFLWAMVLDPATGPLPGTLVPLAVGLAGFAVGLSVFAWGAYRTFVVGERPD